MILDWSIKTFWTGFTGFLIVMLSEASVFCVFKFIAQGDNSCGSTKIFLRGLCGFAVKRFSAASRI
jgi:hypothetical protein